VGEEIDLLQGVVKCTRMLIDGRGLTSNSICMRGGNVFWNINSYLESAFVILNLDMFYSPHLTIVQ
jgi:hypothetical protein